MPQEAFMSWCQKGGKVCSAQASPTRSTNLGGSDLDSSLHGLYICAQLFLIFPSRFVLLQREVRRRDLTLQWSPSSPPFAGSGAALPASPSS